MGEKSRGKRLLVLIVVALLLLTSCQRGPAVSRSYHRCVPPAYPTLQTSPMVARRGVLGTTTDPVEKVSDIFKNLLNPDPWMAHTPGTLWMMKAVGEGYLFQCFNTPSDLETEFGCILLADNGKGGTSIERMWDTSEGGLTCATLLQIPAALEN